MRLSKFFAVLSLAVSCGALGVGIADAAGGKKDAEVQKLIDQAMDEDYLNLELDKAEQKLKKAVDTCGKAADNCTPTVYGKAYVALATIHGVGQSKMDVAKGDLVNALKVDPNAVLIADLATPELEAKFKEAKAEVGGQGGSGQGGSGQGGSGQGGSGQGGSGQGGSAPAPAGDFPHTPVAEQLIRTPVPVFAEIPEELGATKVVVRYKAYGGNKFETLNLERMDGGFGGYIPCEAASSAGELKYFIIGTDDGGTPVATAGSSKAPFKVVIKAKISGEKPSLPGKEPPKQCPAPEDCPPGLPGCPEAGGGKAEGASCDATSECNSGLACLNGVCTPSGDAPKTDSKGTHHMITLTGQFDLAIVSDGADVCSASNTLNYVCMHQDSDQQFLGKPLDIDGTNGIRGGLAWGGGRLLLGYDYHFKFGLGLGGRIGYAFGGPSIDETSPIPAGSDYESTGNSFFPLHVEGRISWKFVSPNPEAGDIAPQIFIGLGAAQVNAAVPVTVCDSTADGGTAECPGATTVDAYQLAGLTFFSFGGGFTYMFVNNFGMSAEVKFMVLFPTIGVTISPTIAPVVAF
ncbi:MAG: hypothetical protein U0271_07745 [Polyangiaceae bacterium]